MRSIVFALGIVLLAGTVAMADCGCGQAVQYAPAPVAAYYPAPVTAYYPAPVTTYYPAPVPVYAGPVVAARPRRVVVAAPVVYPAPFYVGRPVVVRRPWYW